MQGVQMGLDEIVQMLLMRMASLEDQNRHLKDTLNVVIRMIYDNGLIDKDNIYTALKKEFKLMKDIGQIKDMPEDDVIKTMRDEMVSWSECDTDHIIEMIKSYNEQVKEMMQKQNSKIVTASEDTLNALDNAMKNAPKGSKLII